MTTTPTSPGPTSGPTSGTAEDAGRPDRRPALAGSQVAAVLAAVLLVGLAASWLMLVLGGGADGTAPEALQEAGVDPGSTTLWAIPVLGFVADAAAVVVVGCLLVPLLIVKRLGDDLGGVSRRATRTATWAALVWAVSVLVSAVFETSDAWAIPVLDLPYDTLRQQLFESGQGQASIVQVVLVLLVATVTRWVATAREAAWLLGVTMVALVPPVLVGHSASSGSHDLAIVSMVVHVLPAVLWVGGVLALWWRLLDAPRSRARAVRRFSAIATWCFAATALSGVINAWVRAGGLDGLLTSAYGRGTIVKAVTLVVLGVLAWQLRRRLAAGLDDGTGEQTDAAAKLPVRTFLLLTGAELLWMSVAIGLGVALSRTPPPVGEPYASGAEELLGGPMPPAPSFENLLLGVNASGVGLLVVIGGLSAYAVGLRTLHRRGDRWPVLRTVSFVAGIAIIGYTTLGGLGVYSHVMFSAHMVSHMLLSMVAPILLVAGGPVNLALNALPGSDVRGGQGPRQILAAALQSRPAAVLSHPVVAAVLFVGSLYGVYFTGAFGWLMENHLGHAWMEIHFLITGYLFYESLVGIAPVPHRLSHLARLGLLLLVAPFHAFFSIALMSSTQPVGESFYAQLDRPFAQDLAADQYLGGSLSWAVGEIPILMVALLLLGQWFRYDRAESRRHDRREDASDDAELRAYNDRLAAMTRADHEADR
ncbi:cytochrome c oxidase assembly protein [Nocardioides zeae]|uniref:Cytochrome c oxidase assembly protein n=1 Tax=Nocardioides imazamoxiresistens TaxID=3231893 RepID=A0ABU3PWN9_9ACTN|nr:cytochrome c oxidase assembly protein [Nocardioides zeae]MDT9593175.1 cytochrome c oxidase assembly protein [Nocardioides zeae]